MQQIIIRDNYYSKPALSKIDALNNPWVKINQGSELDTRSLNDAYIIGEISQDHTRLIKEGQHADIK